jgi:hypothetical protein
MIDGENDKWIIRHTLVQIVLLCTPNHTELEEVRLQPRVDQKKIEHALRYMHMHILNI